jgi:hypothetical protein
MLQIYNKYGQLKVVSSTSSSGVSSVSGVAPITSTGGSNPIISTLMTTNKLLGRGSVGTGVMQEITLGSGLALTGTILNVTSPVTPYALTKTNDTNVTLTLGGSPSVALLAGVSLTLGWTGTLADSRIASATTWNAKQDALLGTGFVKSTAGVISYDTSTYTPTSRTLTINGTTYDLSADRSWTISAGSGTVTSVGLTVPSAFNVTPSTITTSGTFAITGAGVTSQYVRGDGTLANFPTSIGGGASVSYYLNGSVSQGTIGGVAYKEMNSVPIIGTGTDFTINADGYIAQFITDVGDPNKLLIPAGNWNFETYFSVSSGGGSPSFYIELYKYDGATFTLISSNSATPENITGGTSIDLYFTALAVPATTLLATDRIAVRFYVTHSGRTITMHTEDSHLSQIITTFSTGLTTLNGLTAQSQYFAVGTTGTDFNIQSTTDTHTFNLPTASATNRGALSTTDWTNFNTAYTDRLKWDGGATGLVAATGRTSLGANTVGSNIFTLANPSAITFIRINADNSISTLNATDFRTAIGAGTSSTTGTVTSVAALTLGTSGTDLSSTVANGTTTPVITLNVPDASATARGVITTGTQTIAGAKTFSSLLTMPSTGVPRILQVASSGEISGMDTGTFPSPNELINVKGVTNPIQPQIDAVNVNVITITTSVSITTNTTNGTYGQHGRHVKISNGANPINIECVSTSNADFVASYEKIGAAAITFTATLPATLIQLSGTNQFTTAAAVGSKACLSRNGNVYYLQITNY